MKNKILILLILTMTTVSVFAETDANLRQSDTNDNYFRPPNFFEKMEQIEEGKSVSDGNSSNANQNEGTIPPLKRLRLSVQKHRAEKALKNKQLAPTDPNASIYQSDNETSDFASKEQEEHFDENMMPDGFEADEEAIQEQKKSKFFKLKNRSDKAKTDNKETEDIILDCDNMDYDTEKYCIYATGNVTVEFVKQETTVKADTITYDRMNNTIKADGNVKILKNGKTITGDYIFVDMNEENALIENPHTQTATIEINAKKGYVYGDKIVQENGSIVVDEAFPINFVSSRSGPQMRQMIVPKSATLTNDIEKGLVRVDAKSLKITEKGEHEILAIRHATLYKGKYKLLKIPALKVYTNKNHDYGETNSWEVGSYRGLGAFIGPGFVFTLPKGSTLKAIPMLNYDHRIGVGVFGRFQSGTNFTQGGYGTAGSKILIRGKQKLDDNLYLQYGMNDYLDEWFLGRRRPKYGLNLVYDKEYSSTNFILKDRLSRYRHRIDFGYYHDIDEDKYYTLAHGRAIGTLRARYMAEAAQNLYNYRNEEKQLALSFDIISHLAATVYGTGDTQVVGQVGPVMHSQVKRWMQDIGYYQSVYQDHSPMPVFDAYRYGKSNIYAHEYIRICKYLTLSWFGSLNLSGDAPNNKRLQENAFYVTVGPDDVKFSLGYDIVRENLFFLVEMMMNAKGTTINYDRFEIKQDKKAKKNDTKTEDTEQTAEFKSGEKAPILKRAEVEDIKPVEDVL